MPVLYIVIILIFVGVALYLVNRFVPMDAKIKAIINWLVVIVVIIWLLKIFNVLSYLEKVRI